MAFARNEPYQWADFDDFYIAQTERAARGLRTLAVMVREFPFGPLFESADGGDEEAHGAVEAKAACDAMKPRSSCTARFREDADPLHKRPHALPRFPHHGNGSTRI